MTLPRLSGPRVALVPVPHQVAVAVLSGERLDDALAGLGLQAGAGWPHADTDDGLRPLAEHGRPGEDGGWLLVVDGEVIGECGWSGGPDAAGEVELHYGVAGPHRGQGLGTEAAAVLATWAQAQPGVRQLVAEVLVGNVASRRLLRRLGFTETPGDRFLRCVRPTAEGPRRRIAGRHVC